MTLNIGIIGPGGIAERALAPALSEVDGAALWSVLSRSRERAAEFAKRHGAGAKVPAHQDLDAFLSDPDLHAVIIASPDRLHARQAIACAGAGRHVLVEKPMATSVEEAEAMVSACRKAGVRLAVAYHLRWHAGHRRLVSAIRSGDIGQLRHMRVLWTSKAKDARNWRAGEEVGRWWSLAGVGTHCLDLIRWVMVPACGEVVSVASTVSKEVWKGPHDETAVVSMRFESGATAEFCSSVLFESAYRAEIYGDTGYALCDGTLGRRGEGSIRINDRLLDFEPANPYAGEIRDFVEAVLQNRTPEVDGVEGVRNVSILVQAA